MKTPIASLSIAARATLDMHSLNNEGGEGNQIQTRMVDIVDHRGELHNVNAISGDMLKHVLMEHYYQQARAQHIALCQSCQYFNANRINADKVDVVTGLTFANILMALQGKIAATDVPFIGTVAGPSAVAGVQCKPNLLVMYWQSDAPAEAMGK